MCSIGRASGYQSPPDIQRVDRRRWAALIVSVAFATLPAAAAAQPEVWASRSEGAGFPAAVHIFNPLTGGEIARLDAPTGMCLGSGAMTSDRRSFVVPITNGLARLDTRTRHLVEVIPRSGECTGWVRIGFSGRWWYVRTGAQYQIVDAATRHVVRDETDSTVVAVDFDNSRYFELRAVGNTVVVQAWLQETTGAATTPLWTRTLPGSPAPDLGVDGENVYLALRADDGVVLYRLDAATGAEQARHPLGSSVRSITYFNGLVYVAYDVFAIEGFDANTLELFGTNDHAGMGTIRDIFVDTAHLTLYVVSHHFTSFPKPFPVTYLTAYDTGSLRMLRTPPLSSSGGSPLTAPFGVVLGDVVPPRPVRLTALEMEPQAFRVRWQPDAAGPAPWLFEIHGGRRGEPLVPIVTLDATARAWKSPVLASGSYVVRVVARNGVGAGEPSQPVDVGIKQVAPPEPPRGPSVETHENIVRLTWSRPDSGPTPSGYWIEAAPDAATKNFQPVATTTLPEFSLRDVPAGTWWVRVRGFTAAGVGMPSGFANVLLSVPCAQPPVAPYALVALTTGNVVTLQWNAPTPAPSYLVDVTTCAGGPRRFELEVAGPRPALEAPASPGVYLVQVRARNACGTSPPSNAVVVAVP